MDQAPAGRDCPSCGFHAPLHYGNVVPKLLTRIEDVSLQEASHVEDIHQGAHESR
jgi:hypothetical protein